MEEEAQKHGVALHNNQQVIDDNAGSVLESINKDDELNDLIKLKNNNNDNDNMIERESTSNTHDISTNGNKEILNDNNKNDLIIDDNLMECLINVQQNSFMALNSLLYSTLSSIKPIVSNDWKLINGTNSTNMNLNNLNSNVNYGLQNYLHTAISGSVDERIQRISYLFSPIDAKLIVSLIKFVTVLTNLTKKMTINDNKSTNFKPNEDKNDDVYHSLQSQMSKLKIELNKDQNNELERIWVKVETYVNIINLLCIERENVSDRPPSYYSDLSSSNLNRQSNLSYKTFESASSGLSIHDEKMKKDLENVTKAIERLMECTPQLTEQRVELSQKQIVEMDLAKLAGEVENKVKYQRSQSSSKFSNVSKFFNGVHNKRNENDIINAIQKANSRRLDSQRVEMGSKLDDAINKSKDADLSEIMNRNRAGRMTSQESELTSKLSNNSSSSRDIQKSPSNSSLDSVTRDLVSTQAYIAEHNLNVCNIVVQFKTKLHGNSKELDIEIDNKARDSVILKNLSNFNVKLKLPAQVSYPQRKKIKLVERDLFEFTLQVNHSRKSLSTPVVEPPSHPFSSSDFNRSMPYTFRCAKCSRDLVTSGSINRYRDLPSDNWEEHVDNWMCHPTQELNADYYRSSLNVNANVNEILIGNNYWVFNRSNIADKNVRVEFNENVYHTLHCVCGGIIGNARDETLFKLNKVCVWPITSPKSQPYSEFNIGHFISADLIEQARNYGSYRYFLQDEQTHELRLLIWLFNPLVKIRTSQVKLNSTLDSCKVFWKTNREEPLRESKLGNISKLSYPSWVLDELENILINGLGSFLNNSPKRFFSDWHIGYLERVSK